MSRPVATPLGTTAGGRATRCGEALQARLGCRCRLDDPLLATGRPCWGLQGIQQARERAEPVICASLPQLEPPTLAEVVAPRLAAVRLAAHPAQHQHGAGDEVLEEELGARHEEGRCTAAGCR